MSQHQDGESISFIVPCYNGAKTIRYCIEALLNARSYFFQSEIILVDNASTDGSGELCANLPITIVKEPIRGRSYARNRGAMMAQGKWLAFVDCDVIIDEKWADLLVAKMVAKGCSGAQGRIIPSHLMGAKRFNDFRYHNAAVVTKDSFILTRRLCFETPMINSAACIYNREIFEKVSGFDPLLERHEDIDLSKRIFMAGGDLYCSDQAKVEVIYHGEGWADYLKRSYADGKSKMAYFHKWTLIKELLSERGEGQGPSQKKGTRSSGLRVKLQLALIDALKAFTRFIRAPSFDNGMFFLIFLFNHWGKFMGMISHSYPEELFAPQLEGIRSQGKIFHRDEVYQVPIFFDHQSFEQYYGKSLGFIW